MSTNRRTGKIDYCGGTKSLTFFPSNLMLDKFTENLSIILLHVLIYFNLLQSKTQLQLREKNKQRRKGK